VDDLTKLLFMFITAGAGAFLGSYLKKKGENFATHEDIDKLVAQVTAVTQTTKEIEGKISHDFWEREKTWEVKREALFEAMKELANVEYGLSRLVLSFSGTERSIRIKAQGFSKEDTEATEIWNEALVNFKKARILALLVGGQELKDAFDDLEKFTLTTISDLRSKDEINVSWFPAFRKHLDALTEIVKKELHLRRS